MRDKHARQIADLINDRSGLTFRVYAEDVRRSNGSWVFITDPNDNVAACAHVETVNWYLGELSRVAVRKNLEGKGFGPEIMKRAEAAAKGMNLMVLMLTTRLDNFSAKCLFYRRKFRRTTRFFNPGTGHMLELWFKSLLPSPDTYNEDES